MNLTKYGRLVSSAKQKSGRMEYVFMKVPGKNRQRSQALEGRRVDRKGQLMELMFQHCN